MALPKIALGEAFLPPDGAEQLRSMEPEALRAMCYAYGVDTQLMLHAASRLDEFDELRLSEMDEHGIAHSILSLCASHSIEQFVDPKDAAAEARRINDYLATRVARHPDRYSGFASVAVQAPDRAISELERAVTSGKASRRCSEGSRTPSA